MNKSATQVYLDSLPQWTVGKELKWYDASFNDDYNKMVKSKYSGDRFNWNEPIPNKYTSMLNSQLLADAIWDAAAVRATAFANASVAMNSTFASSGHVPFNFSGGLPQAVTATNDEFSGVEWVSVELPLYVGRDHDSDIMAVMQSIHDRHGDDDTGSLYRVQDSLDVFIKKKPEYTDLNSFSVIDHEPIKFSFALNLPSLSEASALSSWPRINPHSSFVGAQIRIKVTAKVESMYFIGYDVDNNTVNTPLRVKLLIQCQRGMAGEVDNFMVPLLRENGTFFVVGACDLDDMDRVVSFDVNQLNFVESLTGNIQSLIK